MARGVDGREVFIDDLDRQEFLRITQQLKIEMPFSVLAYCLMGNHFHFAIRTENTPLSLIMHRLLTSYVKRFNARHDREGHLFQARFKALLCLDDMYLISLIRYIHLNPVRAGIATSPSDWRWSSHRRYSGEDAGTLADPTLFFRAASTWSLHYRDYALWASERDDEFEPWPDVQTNPILLREERNAPASLDEIALSIFPDDLLEIRSGSRVRAAVQKKVLVAEEAIRHGYSQVSIAQWMNCTPQAVHRLLRRNKLIKLKPDPFGVSA